jgi:tRNA U38,U39,U40 pseudouridine synthase TruA
MVRAIVGAMFRISSGQLSMNEFKDKFIKGERINIQYVPAYALYLHKIIY